MNYNFFDSVISKLEPTIEKPYRDIYLPSSRVTTIYGTDAMVTSKMAARGDEMT